MNINHIFEQVKSPFTDEKLEKLIEKYIECNCDMDKFYRSINDLNVDEKENPYMNDLCSRLFSNRAEKFVDRNDSWSIIGSSGDTLSVPTKHEDRVPIYRIYINAKGQDKAKIVEEYIKECEDSRKDYKLKYSQKDGRSDEIIILSYGEDLAKNIELIETITEGMNLGEPAELVGRYKDKIGIGEEYIEQPIYSYTKTRLGIIPIVMQKYFLDHISQFEKYLDEEHKGFANFLLEEFKEESQDLLEEIEELSEDEKEQREDLIKQQLAYQNNINPNDIGQMSESICKYIPESMQAYMAEHSEEAIPEIIENYRFACEIFGISREGVFSIITEELVNKDKQTALQRRESELSALEAEEKTISEAEALIDKQTGKDGQNIGEE